MPETVVLAPPVQAFFWQASPLQFGVMPLLPSIATLLPPLESPPLPAFELPLPPACVPPPLLIGSSNVPPAPDDEQFSIHSATTAIGCFELNLIG